MLSRGALVAFVVDVLLGVVAWWLAFWLRFNLDIPDEFARLAWSTLAWCTLGTVVGLALRRVDRHVWTHTGLPEISRVAEGVALGGIFTAVAVLMLRVPDFPRSVLLLQPILAFLLMGLARAAWRIQAEGSLQGGTPLVVVGTLDQASEALRALRASNRWRAIGILSPLRTDRGRTLQGVRVLGTVADLPTVCAAVDVRAALVASPPGSEQRREALLLAAESQITLMTMPRADEWLRAESAGPRKVELEDLLGRAPVELDVQGLAGMVSGQTVLVTGAGGSIGSELCRQIARFGAARLVCVDVSEYAIYQLEQELQESHPQMRGIYYTANVRDPERLLAIATRHAPAVVFHAAAYKHVPLMEQLNEIEALRTNVIGTLHAATVAAQCGASRFVMISTDKAVNPTNVMGASKRLAELAVQAVAAQHTGTSFVSVRFGNVLGSSGSVVPLFTRQIARGGPVTVTHPDIVRYFMTIPEAAQLVLQAALMGRSGQIFVLDMGEPVRIVELARMLIRLSGHTEEEIPITFTGLRPGEKLFEELLADDETTLTTPHPKLRIAKTGGQVPDVQALQQWIEGAGPAPSERDLRAWLKAQVPEYQPR
ncbi:polysaccharide biosynthesis protein [Ramlibacter sp. CrO1]|uniref:Polysaccharide biosynthesis protein n=1 Tax=Ramlibacter algicola TaxID=2795217 RepID=A0A934Q3Q1_9BURK|nr:nucleoside-diphosphate sugar epimerase/dehydratase [Ramlibacter algicola]MBK0394293.1 polysaccharide biosynthesis protein [Ramlibacter algicola]